MKSLNSNLGYTTVKSGTVDAVYGTSQDICNFSLLPGRYIICAFLDTTNPADITISASVSINGDIDNNTSAQKTVRNKCDSGGGVSIVVPAIVKSGGANVSLSTYAYFDGSYKIRGTLWVISLLKSLKN